MKRRISREDDTMIKICNNAFLNVMLDLLAKFLFFTYKQKHTRKKYNVIFGLCTSI